MSEITNCKEKLNLYLLRIWLLYTYGFRFRGNRIFDRWQPSSVSHFLKDIYLLICLFIQSDHPPRGHCLTTTCTSFFSFFHPLLYSSYPKSLMRISVGRASPFRPQANGGYVFHLISHLVGRGLPPSLHPFS